MKKARIQVIVWFFLVTTTVIVFYVVTRPREPVEKLTERALSDQVMGVFDDKVQGLVSSKIDLEGKRIETEKLKEQATQDNIKAQIADIPFYRRLYRGGGIGLTVSLCLAVLIGSIGFAAAYILRASVFVAKIHNAEIPIPRKELPKMVPVINSMAIAEQLYAKADTAHLAIDLYAKIASTATAQIAALAQHGNLFQPTADAMLPNALPAATLTFADLLKQEMIAPGKPLIMGFHAGEPEYRDIKNLKSVAIAGWQGSGKTSSAAYILGASVLGYNAEAYVIDPHKSHDEGMYSRIQPLEQTGLVTVINPFDTSALIHTINTRLDRRLRGDESSERPLIFVIDELARLAKMDCFDELVTLLERCTEETRKANIVFLGISTKWTARHFRGRADIRGCMNSALVHKCKPSQADLLLEDSAEKKLVEQLDRPGDAILLTDYAGTKTVSMPYCTRRDMETVAAMVGNQRGVITISNCEANGATPGGKFTPLDVSTETPETVVGTSETCQPTFGEVVRARLAHILIDTKPMSQNKLAELAGISKKDMSEYLNGKRNVSEALQTQILQILDTLKKQGNTLETSGETEQETDVETVLRTMKPETVH